MWLSKPLSLNQLSRYQDVILTNGCSGALDICISCLCAPGSTLLCPRPGFSLYKTLAVGLGVQVQYYDLLVRLKTYCHNLVLVEYHLRIK